MPPPPPSGRRLAWWTSAVMGLAACSEEGPLHVPPPLGGDVRGLVFAYAEGGALRYLAASSEDLSPLSLSLEEGGAVELYAYDRDLEALRIPSGRLAHRADGARLPPPTRRLRLSRDGETAEWSAGETPNLDGLRIELTTPCREFEIEVVTLSPGRSVFLDPLPDGRLLHGRLLPLWTELLFERIDAEGRVEPAGSIPGPHGFAGQVHGDELWLGGPLGRLTRSPLSEPTLTATVVSAPSGDTPRAISVQTRAGLLQVTTVTGAGDLERFDGVSWSTLRPGAPEARDGDEAAIAALPDGTELSVVPFRRVVTREEGGVLTDEPISASGGPFAVGLLRGEPTVGLGEGELIVRRGGAWETLATLPLRLAARAWIELEGGYLVGGDNGLLVEWNDELGAFCEPLLIEGTGGFNRIRRVGELIVVAGRATRGSAPLQLRFLREVPR